MTTPVTLTPRAFQELKRTIRQEARQELSNRRSLSRVGVRRHEAVWMPSTSHIRLRNDYAGTLPARGVVQIDEPVTYQSQQVFPATQPTTTFKRFYAVVGASDIDEGKYGFGSWLWHADWVLYDDANTPAVGETWGPQDGSFEIKKYRYGFEIWGNPTGGTTDLVMAQQQWVNRFLCKSNELITANGDTGAVSVYDGNQADTSMDVSGCVNRTEFDFASGDWGTAVWFGGNWFVEPWGCP